MADRFYPRPLVAFARQPNRLVALEPAGGGQLNTSVWALLFWPHLESWSPGESLPMGAVGISLARGFARLRVGPRASRGGPVASRPGGKLTGAVDSSCRRAIDPSSEAEHSISATAERELSNLIAVLSCRRERDRRPMGSALLPARFVGDRCLRQLFKAKQSLREGATSGPNWSELLTFSRFCLCGANFGCLHKWRCFVRPSGSLVAN